jgi:tetratricopeptide (TPR) repeat protein
MAADRAPIDPAGAAAAAAGDDEPSFPSEEARRSRAEELFARVVEEHGASDAADVARVYLASFAAGAGDAERARELWQDFLDEYPKHMLGAEIRLNLYALDRAAGRGEEVAAELRAMLEEDDRPLPEDVVLHELAVTLEALDREEEAVEHYQRLVSEFPQSPFALAARQKTGAPAPFTGLGT